MINMLEQSPEVPGSNTLEVLTNKFLYWHNNTTVWRYGREGDTTFSSFREV